MGLKVSRCQKRMSLSHELEKHSCVSVERPMRAVYDLVNGQLKGDEPLVARHGSQKDCLARMPWPWPRLNHGGKPSTPLESCSLPTLFDRLADDSTVIFARG